MSEINLGKHANANVSLGAENKDTGMTLDEVASAIQLAMRLGLPGTSKVKVRVGWKGQLQRIDLG